MQLNFIFLKLPTALKLALKLTSGDWCECSMALKDDRRQPHVNGIFCHYLMNIENRYDKSGCHIFFPEITYDSCLYAIAFRQILPLNARV